MARIYLSKSRVMSWRQCPKRLWLEVNRREDIAPSAGTQRRWDLGHKVNDVARARYPSGVLVASERPGDAAKETAAVLSRRGDLIVFEPAFSSDGVFARADLFFREGDGCRFIEVKGSNSLKPYHVEDAAVQAWVIAGGGRRVTAVSIAHLDRGFVYRGDGDYEDLFVEVDVGERVAAVLPEVPRWVAACREVLGGDVPAVAMGRQCQDPYPCVAVPLCEAERRGDPEVTSGGEPVLDRDAAAGLAVLPYPRFYLDFETIDAAVPVWAGTRPWQQVPFQWSCHVERCAGELDHLEFLDTSGGSPLRACAETLLAALEDAGPILVYTDYESRVIKDLAARFDDLSEPLLALRERLFDLYPVTRRAWYHPDLCGSWSLKAVLPTVAPDLDYADLGEVREGAAAQVAYTEAVHADTSPERADELARQMLAYCRLDTLALVRLTHFLEGRSS